MAAIAASAVSNYPTELNAAELYPFGKGSRGFIMRRLKITTVTAADTATAAVLGLGKVVAAFSGYNGSSAGSFAVGVDPVNNGIHIGTGPSSATVYITVIGTPSERVN